MIYELRFYNPHAGRMPDLLARFHERLPALFARHAIGCIGQWVTDEADAACAAVASRFAYLTVFSDLGQREAAWASFGADPQWHQVRAETNAGAEMLRGYDLFLLRPKAFPLVLPATLCAAGVHELLFWPEHHGQGALVLDWLRDVAVPALTEAGATVAACFDFVAGPSLPRSVLWVHWGEAGDAVRAEAVLDACAEPASEGHRSVGRSVIRMRCVG